MRNTSIAFGILGIVLGHTTPAVAQADSGLALRAVRFFAAETRQTEVTAFVRIPYGLMKPAAEGEGAFLRFTLHLRLVDSNDVVLFAQAWPKRVPPPSAGRTNGLDMVRFAVGPGRYRLVAEVEDSVSGARAAASVPLAGYRGDPLVSDLLLAREIRPAAAGDSVPRPGEVRRGDLLLTAAATVVVTTATPHLAYLFETYLPAAEEGLVQLRLVDEAGEVVRDAVGMPIMVGAGTSALTGGLDLLGLPPGAYSVLAEIGLGTRTFTRSSPFVLVEPTITMGRLPE